MFEQELFNYIKNNFAITNYNIGFGYGEIAETQKAPYIVMFPLNNDGTRQVLCDDDDYTDGQTSIQFSVYAKNYKNASYIGRQLDIFLSGLRYLTDYQITLNNTEVVRGFDNIDTGLSLETVTRLFAYTNFNYNLLLAAAQGDLIINENDLLIVNT